MNCGTLECGADPVCGKSCGTCPFGETCVNGWCAWVGYGQPGDPCAFEEVNADAGYCGEGLLCLGIPADGSAGTCPGGLAEECTQLQEEWNIDCVNGLCGVSFCSARCDAAGACPRGFMPADVAGSCYCIPDNGGTAQIDDPCAFGEVNEDAADCEAGLACLGVPADGTAGTCPGGTPEECTELADVWNPDCVGGNCGVSFCAARCDAAGNCPAGHVPQDIGGDCYCIPM